MTKKAVKTKCDKCGSDVDRSNLARHRKQHCAALFKKKDKGRLVCEYCDTKFTQSGSLNRHEKKCHKKNQHSGINKVDDAVD